MPVLGLRGEKSVHVKMMNDLTEDTAETFVIIIKLRVFSKVFCGCVYVLSGSGNLKPCSTAVSFDNFWGGHWPSRPGDLMPAAQGLKTKEDDMYWYLEVMRKFAEFQGRSRPMEYWMFFLVNLLIAIGLRLVEGLLGSPGVVGALYSLIVLVPGIAVSVRRLHDTGRSGWWLLIGFIPLLGAIVLLFFMAQEGQPGPNQYGADPKKATV